MARTTFIGIGRILNAATCWQKVSVQTKPRLLFKKMTRVCEIVDENALDTALDYADLCIDNSNDTVPTSNPVQVKYIDTPRAGTKTYAGRWGLVSNEQGSVRVQNRPTEIFGIIQVLRFGWVSSILNGDGSPDFSSALAKYDKLRKTLTVTWVNLAADALQTLAEAVPATLSGPVIQGNTFTGAWVRKGPVGSDLDEDGQGKLEAVFAIEPDAVGDVQAGTGLILASKSATETGSRALARQDTRALALAALATALASLPAGAHLAGSFSPSGEGYEITLQRADAVLRTAAFTYPSQYGGKLSTDVTLCDSVYVVEGIADADLQTLLDALPASRYCADAQWHYLHYFLRPGISPFGGRVVTHLHCSVGQIIQIVDPWLDYTSVDNETTLEQYNKDLSQHRTRTRYVSIMQTRDYGAAYAFAYTLVHSECYLSATSTVEDHGHGRWKAIRVEIENLWSAWSAAS